MGIVYYLETKVYKKKFLVNFKVKFRILSLILVFKHSIYLKLGKSKVIGIYVN